MNLKEAIRLYKDATSISLDEKDKAYWSPESRHAVYDIIDTAQLVENMGGRLTSRQVIASIILNAQLKAKVID